MASIFRARDRFFVFVTVAVTIVCFSAIGLFAYSQQYEQRRVLSWELNSRLGKQVRDAMHIWTQDKLSLAFTIANNPTLHAFIKNPVDSTLRSEAELILKKAHEKLPGFTLLNIMYFGPVPDAFILVPVQNHNVEGKPKTWSIRKVDYGYSIIDSIDGRSIGIGGMQFSYVKAIADGAESYFSEAKPNAVQGLPPLFMVEVPMLDENGKLLGAFGFGVKLEAFNKIFISDFFFGSTGSIEILDDRGFFVGHRDPTKILSPSAQNEGKAILKHLKKDQDTSFRIEHEGKEWDISASPITFPAGTNSTWWVVFRRDSSELTTELSSYLYWLIFWCALGAVLTVSFVLRMRRASLLEVQGEMEEKERERRRLYTESSPFGILSVNSDGIIEDANPKACEIFGCNLIELLMQSIEERIPDRIGAALPKIFEASDQHERIGIRMDGSALILSCQGKKIDDGSVILFIYDVTTIKAQRKAIEEARNMAESANRTKTNFLANMSHEIRTPMNAIIGMSMLLGRTELDPKQQEYNKKVENASKSLMRMLNEILDFSNIESGKFDLDTLPFDLREIFDEVSAMFSQDAQDKGIALIITIDPRTPVNLKGDPQRVMQVLRNIVSNAIKFTEEGVIEINCGINNFKTAEEGWVNISFTVRDTGIGMTPEQSKGLFQAFSQVDSSSTRKFGGIGLGLALSKRILDAMGGSISFASEDRKGTTFIVNCPFEIVSPE